MLRIFNYVLIPIFYTCFFSTLYFPPTLLAQWLSASYYTQNNTTLISVDRVLSNTINFVVTAHKSTTNKSCISTHRDCIHQFNQTNDPIRLLIDSSLVVISFVAISFTCRCWYQFLLLSRIYVCKFSTGSNSRIHTHTYTHTCTHTLVHTHLYTHTLIHSHTYTLTLIHSHFYTYTYTLLFLKIKLHLE